MWDTIALQHINNAGLSVEPLVKSADLDDPASSYQEAVNQIAEVASGVTPEDGANSTGPASATPATSAETSIPAPEVSAAPTETMQIMTDSTAIVEPTFMMTTATAAVLVTAPLIAPSSVVQALPLTGPGLSLQCFLFKFLSVPCGMKFAPIDE